MTEQVAKRIKVSFEFSLFPEHWAVVLPNLSISLQFQLLQASFCTFAPIFNKVLQLSKSDKVCLYDWLVHPLEHEEKECRCYRRAINEDSPYCLELALSFCPSPRVRFLYDDDDDDDREDWELCKHLPHNWPAHFEHWLRYILRQDAVDCLCRLLPQVSNFRHLFEHVLPNIDVELDFVEQHSIPVKCLILLFKTPQTLALAKSFGNTCCSASAELRPFVNLIARHLYNSTPIDPNCCELASLFTEHIDEKPSLYDLMCMLFFDKPHRAPLCLTENQVVWLKWLFTPDDMVELGDKLLEYLNFDHILEYLEHYELLCARLGVKGGKARIVKLLEMEIQPKNTNNDELNEVLFRFLFANSKFEHVVSDDVIKSLAAAYCNKVDWSAIFRVHPDNRFLLICLFASRVPLPAELRRTVVPFLNARRAELPAVFKRIGQARYAFMLQNLGYDLTKDDTPARRAFWADNYKPKDQLADWLRGRFLLDKTLSSKIRGQKWLLDFCLEFPKFNLLLPGIKEVGEKLQIVPKLSYYGLEDDRYLSWPLVANFKVLPFTDPN